MSGHTLGPWKVAPAREGIIDIFDAHDHDVVTLYGGRLGNAHLIAAAPELLEALRALLALHEAHHNSIEHAAARKAIAKACAQ